MGFSRQLGSAPALPQATSTLYGAFKESWLEAPHPLAPWYPWATVDRTFCMHRGFGTVPGG